MLFTLLIENKVDCFSESQPYPSLEKARAKQSWDPGSRRRHILTPSLASYKLIFKPVLNLRWKHIAKSNSQIQKCLLLSLTMFLGTSDIHFTFNKSNSELQKVNQPSHPKVPIFSWLREGKIGWYQFAPYRTFHLKNFKMLYKSKLILLTYL